MNVLTVNILDMIAENGEIGTSNDLSTFSCRTNDEINDFIKNKAIDFARRKLSVTYLVFDPTDGQLLGYFTLAHKAIDIDGKNLSNTIKRKLVRYSRQDDETDTYTISAFLLAQFGKNYAVDDGKRIRGSELMDCALDILLDIQHRIGGSVVYLDAEDRPKLTSFYEKEVRFKRFGERYSDGDGVKYLQYMRML